MAIEPSNIVISRRELWKHVKQNLGQKKMGFRPKNWDLSLQHFMNFDTLSSDHRNKIGIAARKFAVAAELTKQQI